MALFSVNIVSLYQHIGETGRTGVIGIKEHKRAFESGGLKSKVIYHTLKTDHVPNFEVVKVLASEVNLYESRVYLEGDYIKLQPAPLNEAMTVPSEYTILY